MFDRSEASLKRTRVFVICIVSMKRAMRQSIEVVVLRSSTGFSGEFAH